MEEISFVLNGESHRLSRRQVIDAVDGVEPEPIREHYVTIEGRRYPVKQAFAVATGLSAADFTSHRARDVLRRVGVTADRTDGKAPMTWVLHTMTHGGGHQELELTDDRNIEDLKVEVEHGMRDGGGDRPLLTVTGYSPDAAGGRVTVHIAWRHMASAWVYQREAKVERRE